MVGRSMLKLRIDYALGFFHIRDVETLKRLDGLGGVVLHALEDDDPLRHTGAIEHFDAIARAVEAMANAE